MSECLPLGPEEYDGQLAGLVATGHNGSYLAGEEIEDLALERLHGLAEHAHVDGLARSAQLHAFGEQRVLVGAAALVGPRHVAHVHAVVAVEGEGKEVLAEQLDAVRALALLARPIGERRHVHVMHRPLQRQLDAYALHRLVQVDAVLLAVDVDAVAEQPDVRMRVLTRPGQVDHEVARVRGYQLKAFV